jgi:hypothetical protein
MLKARLAKLEKYADHIAEVVGLEDRLGRLPTAAPNATRKRTSWSYNLH